MFRRPALALLLAALTVLSMPIGTTAQSNTDPQTVIERLFEAPEIQEAWFAPDFLAQVPVDQVENIIAQVEDEHGAFQSVSGAGRRFTVMLERAEVPTQLVLDAEGRIAGLFFESPIAAGDLAQQVEAIAALPGRSAVLVVSQGKVVAEHNADAPLAVGSAAKLAVLKAVNDAVSDGSLAWDQVVRLEDGWRSLPTGILQDWPEGTPLTVATLANLMVSISDNTATDALIRLVGREAVETVTPRNAPFPTTRELFVLKVMDNDDLRRRWIDGDEAARREILAGIADAPLPDVADITQEPTIEVEWFLSARALCALMDDVADLPALHINPGVANRRDWHRVAFKGGSETGVLNFTTRVTGADGAGHCVAATWNNAEAGLDNQKLAAPYQAVLKALRGE